MELSLPAILLGLAGASTAANCVTSQWWNFGGWFMELPATSGGKSYDCTMGKNSNSHAVEVLQEVLNVCYKRGLKVDGDFGDKTYAALRYAQGKAGTTVDGVYGPNTRKKIDWDSDGTGKNCMRLDEM